MDILSGGKIHDGVGPPARGPDHLFHFFGNPGADGRVADIGIDLHEEIPSDDHRFRFRMIDIGRNNGSAAGELGSHKLWIAAFPDSHKLHLGGDDSLTGIMKLRHITPGFGPQRPSRRRGSCGGFFGVLNIPAILDPRSTQRHQSCENINRGLGVRIRAGGVINDERRIGDLLLEMINRGRLRDLSKGHPQIFVDFSWTIDLLRARQRLVTQITLQSA